MSRAGSRMFGLLAACLIAVPSTSPEASAQVPEAIPGQVRVQGSVVDVNTGEPVAGAQVAVEGATVGTQSDDRGAFTLIVPSGNSVLMVRRIGYAPARVPLAGRTTISVPLTRQATTLNEVVSVGYGTQQRSDITGSVSSVSPEQLEDKPNTNIVQALEGSIPGVAVTTSGAGAEPTINIQIRGRNSITASTDPLVVIDGIPYNGTLSELNPNDIASIDVLKDASATAIYGSRGANGVVLVTSKKGTPGKPRVSYSGYTGTQDIVNVPRLMNAEEFAAFKCVRFMNEPTPPATCDAALTLTERENIAAGIDTDWIGVGTQRGSQRQHDVSVAGGSEDTRYFLGGSVLNVKGVARNDEFDRVTFRLNLDQRLASWLNVGTNSSLGRSERSGLAASFEAAFFSNPLLSPYEDDGTTIAVRPWAEDPNTVNPLERLLALDDDVSHRLFSSNYVNVVVPRVPGLTYRLNAGLDRGNRESGTYFGRNTNRGRAVNGEGLIEDGTRNDWTLENILAYDRDFGRHSVDLTALYSEAVEQVIGNDLRMEGFPNDVLGYRSNLAVTLIPSPSERRGVLKSQMGRVNYVYDGRYLATFTTRRDGFSGFGRNHKWGVFPSAALGWNVSNEAFFPFKDRIDALKLRVSYGLSGNQAIQPYQTLARLDDRSYLDGELPDPGYIPISLGNPDLKWETTKSLNFGVDLGMFGERVITTVDIYRKRTSDLLLERSISPVHGITNVVQNIGKTSNNGFEVQLSTLNFDRPDWSWRTVLSLASNNNRIVDLYGDETDDIGSGWFIGQPIDVNYGYKFDGIWQVEDSVSGAIAASAQPTARPGHVRIVDVNGDDVINAEDRTIIGSLEPDYIGGMSNTFKYRRLTLTAFVHTVQGVTRSNILLGTNQVFSDVRRNTVYRQYWTRENPINTYPSNSNSSNPLSVAFYEDASFIRLRDVTVSYDLPASLTSRMGSESFSVYVNGRNLWTQTDWTGLDPELDAQRAIPLERVIIGGIRARF